MRKQRTITEMLRLADRITEIIAEMEARKQQMLAEMSKAAA